MMDLSAEFLEDSGGTRDKDHLIITAVDSETETYVVVFQSYGQKIFTLYSRPGGKRRTVFEEGWNFNEKTEEFRNAFLEETTEETRAKIRSEEYEMRNSSTRRREEISKAIDCILEPVSIPRCGPLSNFIHWMCRVLLQPWIQAVKEYRPNETAQPRTASPKENKSRKQENKS